MTITVRLNQEEQHQLEYLIKDANREPKGYRDQNISDIIRIALNNEWASINSNHMYDDEKEQCDPEWLNHYGKHIFDE